MCGPSPSSSSTRKWGEDMAGRSNERQAGDPLSNRLARRIQKTLGPFRSPLTSRRSQKLITRKLEEGRKRGGE